MTAYDLHVTGGPLHTLWSRPEFVSRERGKPTPLHYRTRFGGVRVVSVFHESLPPAAVLRQSRVSQRGLLRWARVALLLLTDLFVRFVLGRRAFPRAPLESTDLARTANEITRLVAGVGAGREYRMTIPRR